MGALKFAGVAPVAPQYTPPTEKPPSDVCFAASASPAAGSLPTQAAIAVDSSVSISAAAIRVVRAPTRFARAPIGGNVPVDGLREKRSVALTLEGRDERIQLPRFEDEQAARALGRKTDCNARNGPFDLHPSVSATRWSALF